MRSTVFSCGSGTGSEEESQKVTVYIPIKTYSTKKPNYPESYIQAPSFEGARADNNSFHCTTNEINAYIEALKSSQIRLKITEWIKTDNNLPQQVGLTVDAANTIINMHSIRDSWIIVKCEVSQQCLQRSMNDKTSLLMPAITVFIDRNHMLSIHGFSIHTDTSVKPAYWENNRSLPLSPSELYLEFPKECEESHILEPKM